MRQSGDLCITLPSLTDPSGQSLLYGASWEILKTGILAGTRLRKFPWFVSRDFNARILAGACWGEPHPFCFSALWTFLLGVQVTESSHELWVTANCCASGKTWKNGRDLKAEILTDLNWVKNLRELRQQLLGEELSAATSANYLRALWSESPESSCRETNGQLGGNAVLPEETTNFGCLPMLVNQTETISVLLSKSVVCQCLRHSAVLITQGRSREKSFPVISLCHREEMTYYRNCRCIVLSWMEGE